MNIPLTVNEIDWALLRQQKQWLLDIGLPRGSADMDENAAGIISLIDALQDAACKAGVPEVEVFGELTLPT